MVTSLIKKHIEEFASSLRNSADYDDWDYATEPIPGDKTWCKRCKRSKSPSCKMTSEKNSV